MIANYKKPALKSNLRKAFLIASIVAMAAPQFAGAQVSAPTAAEEARAAELMCEVAGVCGDLAATENARVKEVQDGKSTRAMMSIGSVKAAVPSRRATETVTTPERRVITEAVPTPRNSEHWQEAAAPSIPTIIASGETQPVSDFRGQLRVNFALGSAELTEDSMMEIRSFVLAVMNMDDQGIRKSFRIEGHADSSGTEAINLPLSASRAKAVRDLIVTTGLDEGRIEYAGYGSSVPLAGVRADSYLNRRVEAVLVE